MSSDDTKILEFNQYQKSDKAPFIISADPDCITEKTDRHKNNPENSSAAEVSEHIPSGFSMPAWKIDLMYLEVKIAWKSFANS